MRTLSPERRRGTLYGGCLSILVSLIGTPWEPATENKLLFIEDVGAKPYQVDRMLWQLRRRRQTRRRAWHRLRRNARLRLARRAAESARRCDPFRARWIRCSHRYRTSQRTRFASECHADLRRRGRTTCRQMKLNYRCLNRRCDHDFHAETHSSQRHLRHGDGLAGRTAAACRAIALPVPTRLPIRR